MPSYGYDFRLLTSRYVDGKELFTDALGGFITIEEWHVAVHENQGVSAWIILINGLLDEVDGLFAVVSENTLLVSILESEDHEEALDDVAVKLFVVHNQDFGLIILEIGGSFARNS